MNLLNDERINVQSFHIFKNPQEDARSQYVSLFPRHFISEGLTHGHVIVAIGERVDQWLECLPVAIEQEQPKPGKLSSSLQEGPGPLPHSLVRPHNLTLFQVPPMPMS